MPYPRALSLTTLKTCKVKHADGDDLGRVRELIVDQDSGKIAYGVISYGGYLGMGDREFVIPWDAVAVDPEEEVVFVNVERDKLKEAPPYDPVEWPALAAPVGGVGIYGYYGLNPYWMP